MVDDPLYLLVTDTVHPNDLRACTASPKALPPPLSRCWPTWLN